ncbi:MAG: DUF3179 domain-containing protein [Haloarculaceae archaeon]
MRRRRFLEALAAGTTVGLAGCRDGRPPGTPTPGTTRTAGVTSTPRTPTAAPLGNVSLPVPTEKLRAAIPKDQIPAIVDPEFAADWSSVDAPPEIDRPLLPDDTPILGVTRGGGARAYPLRILNWHEVVNDSFGGPLLVTYCVLCGSGVVAERTAEGEETLFGVSGQLWRDDLVLYDQATESLWSQLLATAIRGPLTGERLPLVPVTLATWGEWQRSNPNVDVLLPPPHSDTLRGREATYDYFEPKYHYGSERQIIGYDSSGEPARRTLVLGIQNGTVARAYPFNAVREADVVNDRVGDLPVVVTVTPGNGMEAYVRRVGNNVLRFRPAGKRHMKAGGSRWTRATGLATGGSHSGTRLTRANENPPMFWIGWSNFHPDTDVYSGD